MKKYITILIVFFSLNSFAQSKLYIRGDSVFIQGATNGELILKNSTRAINGFLSNIGNGVTQFSLIDTTNISNFASKVHSLFSATSPLTYNLATGLFAMTPMDATHAGYVAAGVSANKILHGDGTWKDTAAVTLTNYPLVNGSFLFGNSILVGYGNPDTLSFAGMANRYVGATATNLGFSATGIRFAYAQLSKNKIYNYSAPILIAAPDFNDMRGTLTAQSVRYQASMAGNRALAALQFLNSINFIYSGNSGSLNSKATFSVPSGWIGAGSESVLLDYGSRTYWYRHNDPTNTGANMAIKPVTTTNETLTITNVSGTSVVIGTWGTDGVTNNWSRIQYAVDGVVYGTYTPNGKTFLGYTDGGTTDGIMNDAIVVTGLKDSAHTVVLTFLDGGVKTSIDYIGSLSSAVSSVAFPIYRMDLFHMSNGASIGYNYPGGQTTQVILDSCSLLVLQTLSATFPGYRVIPVKTNQYYDPSISAQIQSDGIHPTILGDENIFLSIKDSMSSVPLVGTLPINVSASVNGTPNYIPKFSGSSTIGNSLIYDNGTSIGIGTTTIASNTLLNLTATSSPMISLNNSTTNSGFLLTGASFTLLSSNRNPVTGTFVNTGAASSLIALNSASGNGAIDFFTSDANNTTPTLLYRMNATGMSVGSSTPVSQFNVGTFSQLQANSTGNIIKINNVTTSFPSSQGAANTRLTNDGSGNLSWGAILSMVHNISTPITGGTVSLTNNNYNIINPAGALLALTVNLPSSPANNDVVYIKFTQSITTVTYGNGTVVDGIASPVGGGLVVLTYDSGTTSWY